MYEMLTGRTPWPAGSPRATMQRRVAEEPPDVRALRPDVSEDVARIVRRNLDQHPAERYATAGFLLVALDAALQQHEAATMSGRSPTAP
jgi:serine/threonine-protein kinase